MSAVSPASYDVFLSLGGPDRPEVRRLQAELERIGLTTFIDERDIEHFTGITAEIERALRGSKVLLAYYSAEYPKRSACQFELTAAFLAALREGDPARRIIVVNPEPTEEHIAPVELLDARFAVRPGSTEDLRALAEIIKRRVHELDGPLPPISLTERPAWYTARVPGVAGFVGRYRPMWDVHSALSAADFPLTQAPGCGPVLALLGLPGIGKSALAAAYAWQFGAAHLGGVYWIDLDEQSDGTSAAAAHARYADKVRTLAETLGIPLEGVGHAGLFGLVGEHLASRDAPCLWVVDNVPRRFGPRDIQRLLIPGGPKVRTILIAARDQFDGLIPTVTLDRLAQDEACELLRAARRPDGPDEQAAQIELVEWLGGHPGALELVAHRLRTRQDLLSYRDYLSWLRRDGRRAAPFGTAARRAVAELDPTRRLILRIAGGCGPGPVPAALLGRVAALLDPRLGPEHESRETHGALGDALHGLARELLAREQDGLWTFSPTVRIAADELDRAEDAAPRPDPALIAHCVLGLLTEGCRSAVETELVGHADYLSARLEPAEATRIALLRKVAGYYEARGAAVFAAECRGRILEQEPDSLDDLLAAARDRQACGEHREAAELAGRARRLAADGGTLPALRADLIRAVSLDSLCLYAQADRVWARIAAAQTVARAMPAAEKLEYGIARIHALAVRSELRPAIERAEALLARSADLRADSAVTEAVHHARLELAWLLMLIGRESEAREHARAAVDFYQDNGLSQHFRSLRAQEVLAESLLTPELREFTIDTEARGLAEAEIRRLWQENLREHGESSPFTLSASSVYGYALITQSKPEEAYRHLTALRPVIAHRLGELDPLYLRVVFHIGWALRGLDRDPDSVPFFGTAFEGQRRTLGPAHPHTVRSQFEYGVSLLLAGGDDDKGRALVNEANRLVPKTSDYSGHLRSQVKLANAYAAVLPGPVWRGLRALDKWLRR